MSEGLRRTPCYRSLAEPMLVGGVEFRLFMANIGLSGFMVISLQIYWFPIVSIGIHYLLGILTRSDPAMRQVYINYARQADHYVPWPSARQQWNLRPEGFGRKVLM